MDSRQPLCSSQRMRIPSPILCGDLIIVSCNLSTALGLDSTPDRIWTLVPRLVVIPWTLLTHSNSWNK